MSAEPKFELLPGTLDLLVLKVVALGPSHGYAIAQRLQQVSKDFFRSTKALSIPLSIAWKIAAGSNPNGKNPKPAAKQSSTRSQKRVANKWKPRSSTGSAFATRSLWSSALR